MTLLLGGARSGKSSLAVSMAEAQARPVTFLATAQALDDEMAERIARHRAERPASWRVVEESVALAQAMAVVPGDDFLIVDCLTLWLSAVADQGEQAVLDAASDAADVAGARDAPTCVVSNEVGLGIVPADRLTRDWRDLLGRVNATFAARADGAYLVVAGRLLALQRPDLST